MKALSAQYIIDQRRLPVHIAIAVISIIIAAIFSIGKTGNHFPGFQIHIFLLLLIQVEAFIFIASRVFRKISPVYTRKEVTRILLLYVFHCFLSFVLLQQLSYLFFLCTSQALSVAIVQQM